MDYHVFLSPLNNPKDEIIDYMELPGYEPPHNVNIGFEFLDDAFRMKDKPRMFTEECMAAGSQHDIL